MPGLDPAYDAFITPDTKNGGISIRNVNLLAVCGIVHIEFDSHVTKINGEPPMLCNMVLLAGLFNVPAETLVRTLQEIASVLLILMVFLGFFLVPFLIWRGRVRRRGYSGLMVYLRALPQTEEERLDAVELTMKGVGICILGLLFPPIIVFGVVPLYYGGRKLAAIALAIEGTEEDRQDGQSQ